MKLFEAIGGKDLEEAARQLEVVEFKAGDHVIHQVGDLGRRRFDQRAVEDVSTKKSYAVEKNTSQYLGGVLDLRFPFRD